MSYFGRDQVAELVGQLSRSGVVCRPGLDPKNDPDNRKIVEAERALSNAFAWARTIKTLRESTTLAARRQKLQAVARAAENLLASLEDAAISDVDTEESAAWHVARLRADMDYELARTPDGPLLREAATYKETLAQRLELCAERFLMKRAGTLNPAEVLRFIELATAMAGEAMTPGAIRKAMQPRSAQRRIRDKSSDAE